MDYDIIEALYMFQLIIDRVRSTFNVAIYGLLILRWCGPRIFLTKMAHQVYSRTVFLSTISVLDMPRPSSLFNCTTRLASPSDVKELFRNLYQESADGRYQLIVRKWYHEKGWGDCYITRTVDTGEICMVQWLVKPEHIKKTGWEDRLTLFEEEVMIENQYTLEKFRRRGVKTAAALHVRQIAMQPGFKINKGFTDETNMAQRQWYEKSGDRICARVMERHFLFHVTRKTLEEYNPPIHITELPEGK